MFLSPRFRMGRSVSVLVWIALTGLLSGCEWNDFFNPGEPFIQDKNSKPLVVPVLDTVAPGVEVPDSAYANATDVEPADLVPDVSDYRIGPNDLLSVSIRDLLGEGTGETVKTVRVTATGMINLDYIPPVKATDLTERELEDAIQKAYEDAKLIRNAQISVTVAEARARTFSIQGNVSLPSEYAITRTDFRMLDALLVAKAPADPIGVDYAYVIRKLTPPAAPPSTQPATTQPSSLPPANPNPSQDLLAPPTAPTTAPSTQSRSDSSTARNRTILLDEAAVGGAAAQKSPNEARIFKFDDVEAPSDVRVIRVPINQLRQFGELKYNIVIRAGDMIIVPDPTIGLYYIGGHIQRAGVYSLHGTKVTLKQAWIAAGGADDFAVPGRTEIIRRIGDGKEVFVRIDLGKIWCGQQPDIYLKPDDAVEVGTDFIAPFLAAGRNSFRFTYGFGFLYDRNFYNGPNGF